MGSSRVSLLKSEVVGQLPTASAMAVGELAVNYADKKIYGKHPGSGAVVQVAAAPTHSHPLSDLTQSGATSGQVPAWNGTVWAPTEVSVISGVTSVNTRTGAVTLTKSDVALDNVDNTSDANKPISTATQTALNAKVGSVTTGVANTTPITNMMQITLVGYNAITPAANTLYIIVG